MSQFLRLLFLSALLGLPRFVLAQPMNQTVYCNQGDSTVFAVRVQTYTSSDMIIHPKIGLMALPPDTIMCFELLDSEVTLSGGLPQRAPSIGYCRIKFKPLTEKAYAYLVLSDSVVPSSVYLSGFIQHSNAVARQAALANYDFSIYPNPARSSVTVTRKNNIERPATISVLDPLGRTLLKQTLNIGEQSAMFDIGPYPPGNYAIMLAAPGFNKIERFVIGYSPYSSPK